MTALARLLRLSRARELATNAGQYAVAVLLLSEVEAAALVGLFAVTAGGFYAFANNSLLEARGGGVLKIKGHEPLVLTDSDRRAIRFFQWAGLIGATAGAAVLSVAGEKWGPVMIGLYLLIGYAYSSPRIFLKGVAGAECAANGLAHVLPFLAGYLQFRPLDRFSVCYAASTFLFLVAFYLLHCLEDRDDDQGIKNLCHYLGARGTTWAAMALTALSMLPYAVAAADHPVIAPFLLFFLVALYYTFRLAKTGDLTHVARIRRAGRIFGVLMFLAILVHTLRGLP